MRYGEALIHIYFELPTILAIETPHDLISEPQKYSQLPLLQTTELYIFSSEWMETPRFYIPLL